MLRSRRLGPSRVGTQWAVTFAEQLNIVPGAVRDKKAGLSEQAPPTGPSPALTCAYPSSPRSWLGAMRCFSLRPPSHFLQLSRKPGAAGQQSGGAGPPLAAPPQQPSAAALGMLSRQGRFSSRSRKLGCSGCKERRRGENGALHQ